MARSFLTVREPRSAYDVTVIGAGVGGLVCAALLARIGLRVLLVEQHYMVGGYCSTFRRRGYTFDAATHFYPLLGNQQTITGGVLHDLGVDTRWIKMDPVDRFHLPDGWTFDVPADFERYRRRLTAAFPLESGAIDRFFARVRTAYLEGILRYFEGRDVGRSGDLHRQTLLDVINAHFSSPRLKLLLMADCGHWGSPPSRTSFVFDSMLRLGYFEGNYYPEGGSQVFVDGLARCVSRFNGDILMNARVTRIAVERNRARGIEIETGPPHARRRHRVHADVVISNGDLLQTCDHLVGPAHLDGGYLSALRTLRPTRATFLTHLGVRGLTTAQLEAAHGYHWRSWDAEQVAHDGFIFKLFVPTLYDPSVAPPGCHILIVQKLVDVDYRATTDWQAHKAAIEAGILSDLERIVPGLAAKTEVSLSATAQTSWRYTLNEAGAMLGWEMSPDQLGTNRPSTTGPIENLHFVGHWTQPGGGITPVMVSAIQVAAAVGAPRRWELPRAGHPRSLATSLRGVVAECR